MANSCNASICCSGKHMVFNLNRICEKTGSVRWLETHAEMVVSRDDGQ